jgi:hypothetical protein
MPTTPATRAASPWRIPVIVAVGVLAVGIGATLGSFLLTSRASTLGAAAAYVPADAPMYVEFRVLPSASQDASLRELLGHFPAIEGIDLERPLVDQLTERLDELFVAQADVAAHGFSWADDVAPWFDGRVAFALTDASAFTAPMEATPDIATVPFVYFLGVSDVDAAEAAIGELRDIPDAPTFTTTEHAGVTIQTFADASAPVSYALTDDQLVIGLSVDAVADALDAHADRSSSLAGDAGVGRLAAQLPADWLAFASWDLTDAMSAALDAAGSPAPEVTGALRELVEQQPLRGAMAFSAAGDRLALDAVADAPTGAFALSNEERGLADEVPADAVFYSEGGNLGPALAAFIGAIKDAAAATPEGADGVAQLEAALGVDLEDLLSWIDDGALTVGWDGTQAYGGFDLVPADMDAATRRLDQLTTFARLGALDPGSPFTVEDSEVAGVSVTTIRVGNPMAGGDFGLPEPDGISIQYAVTDDRVLIGVGDAFLGRALELDAGDSLASVDRFSAALETVGPSANAGMAWLDIDGLRELVEMSMTVSDSDAGAVYVEEIQPWLEPLNAIVSVSRLDGDHLVQRAALLVD